MFIQSLMLSFSSNADPTAPLSPLLPYHSFHLAAITRDSRHKRRSTGGRRHPHQKQRKYESARPASMTRMGPTRVHLVRGRGGTNKFRALRLETGNFAWASEHVTKKVRVLDVVYNASNNELVRTKTLVKSAVVQVDAGPFKTWFESHYRLTIAKKNEDGVNVVKTEPIKKEGKSSSALMKKVETRQKEYTVSNYLGHDFK